MLEQSASTARFETTELEAVLHQANPAHHKDFLQFLLGETSAVSPAPAASPDHSRPSRLRLYSDKRFFLEGYRFLREQSPDYPEVEGGHRPSPPRGICAADWGRSMNGAM